MRMDGTRLKVELSTLPMVFEDKPAMQVIAHDITARVAANEALRQSEESKSAILETALDAIISIDHEGLVQEWNPAAQRIFGYSRSEALGRSMDELIIPRALRETYQDGLANYLITGAGSLLGRPIELTLRRLDGTEFRAELAISRVPSEEPRRCTALVRDITKQREAEAEIRRLNACLERRVQERTAQLQATNQELEAFSYSVSHDLRAPLRAMQGFTTILVNDYAANLDVRGEDYARRVREAADRMDKLIQSLLDYGRLGHQEFPLHRVNLEAHVDTAVSDLVQKGKVNADIQLARPIPDVIANGFLIDQVLKQLLTNAVTFTGNEKPRVEIRGESHDSMVRLSVQDNGIGIAPEYQEKVFRLFERLQPNEIVPGTGIGLALVFKAVQRMKGSVGVHSKPGKGSRFWVDLPAATDHAK
jgi:PAS domain S-box-containing protein